MKKMIMPLLLASVLITSACSTTPKNEDAKAVPETVPQTITYQAETGPIEVPAEAKRVVILNAFISGGVMKLGSEIVGIDMWSKSNPGYAEYLEGAVEVSDESVETILELEPDLIIATSTSKNLDKLSEIAPTVAFTYGKVDYLTQFLEIGKLLNKEAEAQAWIDDFKARAKQTGDDVRAKIGEDATVTVVESFEKQLYVFGDNWGRGTEILYQEMKLKMPEKVMETALEPGYYTLSAEVFPEFAGDYVIFSKNPEADNSFQETETYRNIPAVKNGRLFEANAKEFYYNDPLMLDRQLEFFRTSFLGN